MRLTLSACLCALALFACSQADEAPDAEETETGASGDTVAGDALPDGGEPAPAEAGDQTDPASPYASRYTKLDLDDCRVLDQSEDEGSWVDLRCSGYQGTPLFVSEGDLRFDLDAGVPNERFQTLSPFNDIGDTIEWRLKGGKPFAVIFRFRDVSNESGPRSVLAVEKVGTKGAPGCRVAQIAGETPQANARAREIADRSAATFDCSKEPQMVGNAG